MTASFWPVQWGDGGGTDQVTEGEDGPGAWRLEAVLSLGQVESEMPCGDFRWGRSEDTLISMSEGPERDDKH